MKKAVFRGFSKLLCSFLALCLLTGLAVPAFAEENVTLWLVTEETVSDGMNAVAENLIDAYEKEHKNLTIRMDILPASEKERAACLSDLRQKIAQGKGPDLYLLPTSNVLITDRNTGFTYQKIEPLFGDVRLSMEDGAFLDIGEFYDKDRDSRKRSSTPRSWTQANWERPDMSCPFGLTSLFTTPSPRIGRRQAWTPAFSGRTWRMS